MEKIALLWKWPSRIRERITHRALCHKCRNMLREVGKVELRQGETFTSKTVSTSTELPDDYLDSNCALCMLFLDSLSFEQNDRMYEHKLAGPHLKSSRGRVKEFNIDYFVSCDNSGRDLGLIHSISDSEYTCNFLNLLPSRDLGHLFTPSSFESSTASQASLAQAKHWLDTCAKLHATCSSMKSSNDNLVGYSYLPSRLIDVGTDGVMCPRLVERVEITSEAKYLTLSHCWGRYIQKRLLKENFDMMKQKIDLEDLSKTFRDALFMTRHFGVRYIWIDALCIIQDSEEDWQIESAQMDRIYSSTYCNLSATAASDGSVGLFFEHDTRIFQPLQVRLKNNSYYIIDTNIWFRNIEDAPLNRRAWVCQERMLSPRNLHFASIELFWECKEQSGCETYPMGFPSCVHGTTTKRINPETGSALRAKRELPADSMLDLYMVWGAVVQAYSKGALTLEIDKLIAIAGIAANIQPMLKDRYLAGMWERHLASSLTWKVNRDDKSTRPKRYIAPSWSWASVNGEVRNVGSIHCADGRGVLIDILAAHVDYDTSNIFGRVKGGSLCVRGNLAKMAVNSSRIFPTMFAESPVVKNISVYPDVTYLENQWLEWDHNNLYCLPVENSRQVFKEECIEGILLEPTENAGEFRRWGYFCALSKVVGVIWEGCKAFDRKAHETGLEYCDDGKGCYKYTLTII